MTRETVRTRKVTFYRYGSRYRFRYEDQSEREKTVASRGMLVKVIAQFLGNNNK